MIGMRLSEAADSVRGTLHGHDTAFSGCSTDSRTLRHGELFIALHGEQFDGHDFIATAAQRGASGALVERSGSGDALPLILVDNAQSAMGELASAWRARFEIPVVAITGSNGKTTVKEMVASILSRLAPVHATRGNLNNEIGVPLTLFGLGPQHRFLVLELGANHSGEIRRLSRISRPLVAVVTQCAPAHLEGFGSVEGVARAKAEIFEGLVSGGVAILNADDRFFHEWQVSSSGSRQLSFGFSESAQVRASGIGQLPQAAGSGFRLTTPSGEIPVNLPLPGVHNIMNALASAACAEALGVPLSVIRDGLEAVSPVKGRLQLKEGARSSRVLDDTYNANPVSLKAALGVLKDMPGRRWLVLGDMGELGEAGPELHRAAGENARNSGVERLYAVGPLSRHAVDEFGSGARHFAGVAELNATLQSDLGPGVTILVKGSRRMGMERVVDALTGEDLNMLLWLSEYLVQYQSGFNVFQYITVRTILGALTSLFIALLVGPALIASLGKYQIGQAVRNDGPQTHLVKAGTPTMGGLLILVSIAFSTLCWADLGNRFVWTVFLTTLAFGVIGWIDDYRKVVRRDPKGLVPRWKYLWQSVAAVAAAAFLYTSAQAPAETQLIVPFIKSVNLDLGWGFVVLAYFVIVGSSNGVNLTDGLDGLAILPTVMVAGAMAIFAYVAGNARFAEYLGVPYVPGVGEVSIFCGAMVGAGLGFLWFNTYPAQVFMGDIGALALGAALGVVAVVVRQELVLFIMGGVFVVETLSVILQVASFRLTGRRIFAMAPLHHHFELKGWPEPRVIVRFWIITVILVLIGLSSLKIR